jgi:hypothetical protein
MARFKAEVLDDPDAYKVMCTVLGLGQQCVLEDGIGFHVGWLQVKV